MSPLIVGSGSSGSEGRSDRFGLPTGTSDPGTAEAGDLYYKTDTNKIRYYDGTQWLDLAAGGGGGGGGVTGLVSHSMRLSDDRIGYLYRTPSSAGNGNNWTFSAWIKYDPESNNFIFGSGQQSTNDGVYSWARIENSKFTYRQWVGGVLTYFVSDPVFRDPSAWYHLVMAYDSPNATADDRFKVYINGEQITTWETRTNPVQNVSSWINSTKRHQIGLPYDGGSELTTQAGVAYDGMMADIYLIDGQTLSPTAFAETDSTYGHWTPIAYTGIYGTNGFHIDMGENSYVGYDSSGSNNNYTAYKVFKNWVNGTSSGTAWGIVGDGIEQQTAPTNGVAPSDKYYLGGGLNGTLTFYPSIKAKTSIEFYAYTDGATGATVSADGGTAINITGGGANSWNFTYHNLNVTELSQLSIVGVVGGTFQVGGFRVDGVWYPVGHYSHKVDIITGTLGKALGGAMGGYTTGKKEIIEILRQKSRPYLFSNSLAPSIVGAANKVFEILSSSTELRDQLEKNTQYFKNKIIEAGFDVKDSNSPIIPIMLYDATLSQRFADMLLDEGVYAVGFFYPVVPKGKARIRTQISAAHSKRDLDTAIHAFIKVGKKLRVI